MRARLPSAAITLGTHSASGGFSASIEEVKEQILKVEGQDGITLSGGDPFFQVEGCLEIAQFCKENSINVWCYTGYTFEKLLRMSKRNPNILSLLQNINVLIDGKFIEKQKDLTLLFRGSKNQRVLDVKESLLLGRAVEIEKYKQKSLLSYGLERLSINKLGKVENMFI